MTATTERTAEPLQGMSIALDASAAALSWSNAFLAAGQDEDRPLLYRTLAVEFFSDGVQFIATDGTMLFRTWCPAWGEDAAWAPDSDWEGARWPLRRVVVMDRDKFALGFINTLKAATKELTVTLTLSIEDAPERGDGEAALGDEFSVSVLTLRALGQQLHCRLYEHEYPNWRALDFGVPASERVDGMALSSHTLATLGKVKVFGGLNLDFTGENKRINVTAWIGDTIRGLVMPMRRPEKEKAKEQAAEKGPDATQADLDDVMERTNAKVLLNGEWVKATPENMRAVAEKAVNAAVKDGRRGRPGSDFD